MTTSQYVGPLGPLRARHGAGALLTYQAELASQLTPDTTPELWAGLIAGHMVEVDDVLCRDELGLVVGGDRIWRADVLALLGDGPPAPTCGGQAPALDCTDCVRALAWARIRESLAD